MNLTWIHTSHLFFKYFLMLLWTQVFFFRFGGCCFLIMFIHMLLVIITEVTNVLCTQPFFKSTCMACDLLVIITEVTNVLCTLPFFRSACMASDFLIHWLAKHHRCTDCEVPWKHRRASYSPKPPPRLPWSWVKQKRTVDNITTEQDPYTAKSHHEPLRQQIYFLVLKPSSNK